MRSRKIIIIGGVAGGATAATRLRRLSEEDEIILIEKGEYISFANCGLPYHIGGVISEREALLVQTVEGMSEQYHLDIRNFSEVVSIHPENQTITVRNVQTGAVYEENYDELIISTGAKAIVPPIPGIQEAGNIFSLRNIPDMDQIKAYLTTNDVKTATVVGGGFIGLEMMENLAELGLQVQLVERTEQVMPNIDFELAQILHEQISLQGVDLYLNDGLAAFKEAGRELHLASGTILQSDVTILALGVLPESHLAKEAGLALGIRDSILVNHKLQTSHEHIYAIGDVIQVTDFVTDEPTLIPLAWPANRQGRLVADIINGYDVTYPATQGTSVAKVFALTVAATGNSERSLKEKGIDYQVAHIHPNDHAGYYPGASPLAIKLLFDKNDRILGAQAVGTKGVAKRIDVIATAMKLRGKASQLQALELAYAPPYSSAKDPVNMLGYVAENMLTGNVATFQWTEIPQLQESGAYLLDVREAFERSTGELASSQQIPLNQLRKRLNELPKDQIIYVYCQVGLRGYNAARLLQQAGFEVKNLDGGYKTYKQGMYQVKNQRASKGEKSQPAISEKSQVIAVDACGLQCPGPILKVKSTIDSLQTGEVVAVKASDFGFLADIEAWCNNTGNTLVKKELQGNLVYAEIAKGATASTLPKEGQLIQAKEGATMVVFSGDLDKAIASMIIASGAAAMGKQVTIFFTFWGLSMLKKQRVKKSGLAKAFDLMLPKNAQSLPVSKMNMAGLGRRMIQKVMEQKNVDSLPVMIDKAQELGVKFVACTMSMDIMGIQKEELFDFVEYGGVATYLGDTTNADLNLFI